MLTNMFNVSPRLHPDNMTSHDTLLNRTVAENKINPNLKTSYIYNITNKMLQTTTPYELLL